MEMKKVLLIGVPHHSNLGDHAIAKAEKQFIKQYFPDYVYTEIAEENVHKCIDKIKGHITNDDIIMLHGGGNLENQYLFIETGRRKIVQEFDQNLIIGFPQTIFFTNTKEGKKEFELSKMLYGNHKNMVFMAREEKSYEIMKENLKNNKIYLTPDIVAILNESLDDNLYERDGAMIILRNDSETKVDMEVNKRIEEYLKQEYSKIERTDTAQGGVILGHNSEKELNEMFTKYKKIELVVTDRLHGMIFAVITGTPCIALDNYNHKIKETYKWFKNCKYIKYIEEYKEFSNIKNAVAELKNLKYEKYDNKFAIDIFNRVVADIKLNYNIE